MVRIFFICLSFPNIYMNPQNNSYLSDFIDRGKKDEYENCWNFSMLVVDH